MDRIFVKYDRAAKEADILVVPACGFDCVPNDLGVEYTRRQFPDPALVSVRLSTASVGRSAICPEAERALTPIGPEPGGAYRWGFSSPSRASSPCENGGRGSDTAGGAAGLQLSIWAPFRQSTLARAGAQLEPQAIWAARHGGQLRHIRVLGGRHGLHPRAEPSSQAGPTTDPAAA